MNCDPNSLLKASVCLDKIIPRGRQAAVQAYLLCAWANAKSPTGAMFSYAPASALISWQDKNGSHSPSNLSAFNATADIPSVSAVGIAAGQGVTSVSNLKSLPALSVFNFPGQLITSLDLSGCNLAELDLDNTTGIASINVSGMTNLKLLHLPGCTSLASIGSLTGITLNGIDFSGTALASISFPSGLDTSVGIYQDVLFSGCPNLTSATFAGTLNFAGSLGGQNCPLLTSVTLGAASFLASGNGIYIDFSNDALNVASVNSLLHSAVTNGFNGGGPDRVRLAGGTNAAPTGQGLTDKATLIAAGVIVNTN